MPATLSIEREREALPPSPSNGNQPGRGSLAALTAPAPPRQIPAAPSPPAVRHQAGPMAEGHRPEGDFEGRR